MIEVRHVSKVFTTMDIGTVTALAEVSLTINDNEFFTLLGPSGCGKTTLLRLIGGFETPSTGEIRIDGVDVAGLPPHKRRVNTVFQSYALFPHLTIAQNIAFGLEMLKWSKADIDVRVKEMLALVRLEGYGERNAAQLSGGQQQRVALARALAPRPSVLLLDEPLSALDLKLRKGMQVELKRLQRETGITFVLVTHDQEEALAMSDRIAVMSAGHVLQIGRPEDIYDDPNCCFVADFIGEANLIPGALLGRANVNIVTIRPERVTVGPGDAPAARIAGTVAEVTFIGPDTLYDIGLKDGTRMRARVRGDRGRFHAEEPVTVHWPDEAERELAS
ncbi:MAG: ABC transporter ATP-binding protein [Parvibaculaceae bacterium]|nr:ABC transporter ATP-binding protein [Parvibaculaceae bacterium]